MNSMEYICEHWDDERRYEDPENETIVFEYGDTYGNPFESKRVWFCRVTKNGLTVEDYNTTKRSALRDARRSWRKAKDQKFQEQHGYPKVIE
jgi:hypothetical protein